MLKSEIDENKMNTYYEVIVPWSKHIKENFS